MLKQYRILTDCLYLLKNSHLPVMDKLRLEVQLIQAKRLLLNDEVGNKVEGVASSESEFGDLYRRIQEICAPQPELGQTANLLQQLTDMTEQLKGHLDMPLSGPAWAAFHH
ncbi:hypothetical protein [Geomesophilobacter sediminis]|uniref:Uncharacterized protein n=1 Tax=Geomesophilobacter sediminis TaxID=2798584 RepID=A0A8J7M2J2_9BACT|nr:hypothetical protein [Geomesophilobacter sediminis]MBJ6727128.1 hypothetical protein [Geomesophilobacter sediminis]